MKLTLAVVGMVALALAAGYLAGYWSAMCNGWPWDCQAPITGPLF